MNQNRLPEGWDEERVRRALGHYEDQSDDDAVAEDEAALAEPGQSLIEVPSELVPAVRELIARHKKTA